VRWYNTSEAIPISTITANILLLASCLRTDLFSSYYGGIQIGNWKSIAKYIFGEIIRHYSVSREKKKIKKRSESVRSYMKSFRCCMMIISR